MDLSTCGSVYGFNLGLSEEVTESILTDYLHQQGGAVNRSSRLVGLTPHTDGVRADIERDGERYHVDARWVVGCDGLHSPTRELSGVGFEGHDLTRPWAVFDATLRGWAETFEASFIYLETVPVERRGSGIDQMAWHPATLKLGSEEQPRRPGTDHKHGWPLDQHAELSLHPRRRGRPLPEWHVVRGDRLRPALTPAGAVLLAPAASVGCASTAALPVR